LTLLVSCYKKASTPVSKKFAENLWETLGIWKNMKKSPRSSFELLPFLTKYVKFMYKFL